MRQRDGESNGKEKLPPPQSHKAAGAGQRAAMLDEELQLLSFTRSHVHVLSSLPKPLPFMSLTVRGMSLVEF